MKTIFFLILIILFFPLYVKAELSNHDKITITNQFMFLTLVYIDWRQTKDFTAKGVGELNPILGKFPSQERIDTLILAAAISHTIILYILPEKWRDPWQNFFIATEINVINRNYSLNWKMPF